MQVGFIYQWWASSNFVEDVPWRTPLGGDWRVHKDNPAWKIMSFNVNGFLSQKGTVGIDFGWDLEDAKTSWDRTQGVDEDLQDILKEHSTVKIIHGRNGLGKTTFLNMIEEVGDLLRHSVPSAEGGIKAGNVTDKSVFRFTKNQSKNLFNRDFNTIEISLAHPNPMGWYTIPDEHKADGDERLANIKITKIPNRGDDGKGKHGETTWNGIPFCYGWDEFDNSDILFIEPMNLNCFGKYAVLVNGNVHYLEYIIPTWLDDFDELEPGELLDMNWTYVNEEVYDWLFDQEGDGEFGWDTQLSQLRNLDIIKIQVERKSVPVLDGISAEKELGGRTFEDWAIEKDPSGQNRGLLQICWHWDSLVKKWKEDMNDFGNGPYQRDFVESLAKMMKENKDGTDIPNEVIDAMWDDIETWISSSEALGEEERESLSFYCEKNYYNTTETKDNVYLAHTLTCYIYVINQQLHNLKLNLLNDTINDNFEKKELSFSKTTIHPPKLYGDGAELPVWILQEGKPRKITELSSGEANLLIIHFILTMYSDGRIVLIDEPENSMHPEWKIRFIDDLKKITSMRSTQAIVATHSPMILGNHLEDTIELELQQDEG